MTHVKLDFAKQGGLIPVIVTDHETGQVLMLAYMNEESYQLTLATKTMHYWSRSRNELWHKGALLVAIISMLEASRQTVMRILC